MKDLSCPAGLALQTEDGHAASSKPNGSSSSPTRSPTAEIWENLGRVFNHLAESGPLATRAQLTRPADRCVEGRSMRLETGASNPHCAPR